MYMLLPCIPCLSFWMCLIIVSIIDEDCIFYRICVVTCNGKEHPWWEVLNRSSHCLSIVLTVEKIVSTVAYFCRVDESLSIVGGGHNRSMNKSFSVIRSNFKWSLAFRNVETPSAPYHGHMTCLCGSWGCTLREYCLWQRDDYGCLVLLVTQRDNRYIEEARDIREEGRQIVLIVPIILSLRK